MLFPENGNVATRRSLPIQTTFESDDYRDRSTPGIPYYHFRFQITLIFLKVVSFFHMISEFYVCNRTN